MELISSIFVLYKEIKEIETLALAAFTLAWLHLSLAFTLPSINLLIKERWKGAIYLSCLFSLKLQLNRVLRLRISSRIGWITDLMDPIQLTKRYTKQLIHCILAVQICSCTIFDYVDFTKSCNMASERYVKTRHFRISKPSSASISGLSFMKAITSSQAASFICLASILSFLSSQFFFKYLF